MTEKGVVALLVEDNPAVQHLARIPDLILLDLNLPKIDGHQDPKLEKLNLRILYRKSTSTRPKAKINAVNPR